MKFRTVFSICSLVMISISLFGFAWNQMRNSNFKSSEINRDDAKRQGTTLLESQRWTRHQIAAGANSFRLLTNASISSADVVNCKANHPRDGWRYAIEYELLDASGNVLKKSAYHFRAPVRQLKDADSGELIYPMFFGASSLVATQTRAMQIALQGKLSNTAVIKTRVLSMDPEIKDVVARALARVERERFDHRQTWNRMSENRREAISKYCVYGQDLLTDAERSSLLRWRWTRCAAVGKTTNRYLFFIGDVDDKEVRNEELPIGQYADPDTIATIPVPEGNARVTLQVTRLDAPEPRIAATDSTALKDPFVAVTFQGLDIKNRKTSLHALDRQQSVFDIDVSGGILAIESSARVIVRAFWKPLDDLALQTAANWRTQDKFLIDQSKNSFEITSRPILLRSFMVNEKSINYNVSHNNQDPTPVKISVRYPLSSLLNNATKLPTECNLDWQFIDGNEQVVRSGTWVMAPMISTYDWLSINGRREKLSDPSQFFVSVPATVRKLRLSADGWTGLVNVSVRPAKLQATTRVPEDYHAFNRIQSPYRSWFPIQPPEHLRMIRENQAFLVATQVRLREPDQLNGSENTTWTRFQPAGNWIGRQLFVPKSNERDLEVAEQDLETGFFHITGNQPQKYTTDRIFDDDVRVTYLAKRTPARVTVQVDGVPQKTMRVLSKQGALILNKSDWPAEGTIEIVAPDDIQFFVRGLQLDKGQRYIKRTAQRLIDGQLQFNYEKQTKGAESITLCIYRQTTIESRCQIRVQIEPLESPSPHEISGYPFESWTLKDRLFDLRPNQTAASYILGNQKRVDLGHRCFLQLGSELSPGNYRIRVTQLNLKQGDGDVETYALLYQSKIGAPGNPKIRSGIATLTGN